MDQYERNQFLALALMPKFQARVKRTKEVIVNALRLPNTKAYISTSFGKDSVVMMHLCQSIDPSIQMGFYGTPEMDLISNYSAVIADYSLRFNPTIKIVISNPEWANTNATISERIGLSETHNLNFMGLRYEENPQKRGFALAKYGETYRYSSGSWRCCPLAWWKWQDIWAYICLHDLPYLEAYDRLDRARGRTTPHLRYWLKHTGRAQTETLAEISTIYPRFWQFLRENYPDEI